MKRKMMIAVAAVMLLILLVPLCACAKTYYIKTASGGGVRLRDEPTTDAVAVAKLNYGTAVNVVDFVGKWAAVDWPGRSNPAWVARQYLTRHDPGLAPKKDDTKKEKTPAKKSSVAELDFSSFRLVDPYYAYIKANHAGGYVNLRWAPSMDAAVAQRINDGSEVKVIAEGNGWVQLTDERSGFVGFMKSGFVIQYEDDSES